MCVGTKALGRGGEGGEDGREEAGAGESGHTAGSHQSAADSLVQFWGSRSWDIRSSRPVLAT